MTLTLIIGNRNYSSWSLRAWWYMRRSGLSFETVRIPMFTDEWQQQVARYSPAGRVPVLVHDQQSVWDTWSIFEHLQEHFPDQALGWPTRQPTRSHARSIAAEMHSGFMAIRENLPQNLRAQRPLGERDMNEATRSQVARVLDIWTECYERHDGPWLFGDLSIADVMYAPVALRFVTYSVTVPEPASDFVAAVRNDPDIADWTATAEQEAETLPFIDELVPAATSPLTLG